MGEPFCEKGLINIKKKYVLSLEIVKNFLTFVI